MRRNRRGKLAIKKKGKNDKKKKNAKKRRKRVIASLCRCDSSVFVAWKQGSDPLIQTTTTTRLAGQVERKHLKQEGKKKSKEGAEKCC